jgi:protein-L-isoaspartate(D-aspartate) O-methyltransferase
MNHDQARFNLVEQQVRPWQVLDPQVLAALGRLPREKFVPANLQTVAYTDTDLAIGQGESLLAARIDARLAQDAQLKPTDRVLDVGTGTGYMAALLSALCAQVVSVERLPELAQSAQARLASMGFTTVQVLERDASQDLTDLGAFDAIILNGSVADVPEALLGLLKPHGRLLAIVGDAPIMRVERHTRVSDHDFQMEVLWDIVAPRLSGFAEHSQFSF